MLPDCYQIFSRATAERAVQPGTPRRCRIRRSAYGRSRNGCNTAYAGKLQQDLRFLLGFGQRRELLLDVAPIQRLSVAYGDALRVANIYGAGGKQLQDDQVLGGTGAKVESRRELERSGMLHHEMLERQRAKGDVPTPFGELSRRTRDRSANSAAFE